MNYDTAGNEIKDSIKPCDCNSTGGCPKCRLWGFQYKTVKWLKPNEWGFLPSVNEEETPEAPELTKKQWDKYYKKMGLD